MVQVAPDDPVKSRCSDWKSPLACSLRGCTLHFDDSSVGATEIEWSSMASFTALLVAFVVTSPQCHVGLLRRTYNFTHITQPELWVIIYSIPIFVTAIVYIGWSSVRSAGPKMQYARLGDHLIMIPLFAAVHLLSAWSLGHSYIRSGDYIMLSMIDFPFSMALGTVMLHRSFDLHQYLAVLGLMISVFLYVCTRYNNQFFWARFNSSELRGYMYVIGARFLWSLRCVGTKTLMRWRAVQQHATIHPEAEDDDDVRRHIFPETDTDDQALTDLDKVFGSSLFDSVPTSVDLHRTFEMHMLGAGVGVLPAAILSAYFSVGSDAYSSAATELMEDPAAALWLGWASVSLIVHPLIVTQLVVKRTVLSYPVCQLVACVCGVIAGSYFAEKNLADNDTDGVHPLSTLQGLALVLLVLMLVYRANGALVSLERDYAEVSLRSLRERLPKLSVVPVRALCGVNSGTSERLYAQAFSWMDARERRRSSLRAGVQLARNVLAAHSSTKSSVSGDWQQQTADELFEALADGGSQVMLGDNDQELLEAYCDVDYDFVSTSDKLASVVSSRSSGAANKDLDSKYQRLVDNNQAILGPNTLSPLP